MRSPIACCWVNSGRLVFDGPVEELRENGSLEQPFYRLTGHGALLPGDAGAVLESGAEVTSRTVAEDTDAAGGAEPEAQAAAAAEPDAGGATEQDGSDADAAVPSADSGGTDVRTEGESSSDA